MIHNYTSELLFHAPCPSCGSRDNLAVYTDHKYCFGCRYYEGQRTHNFRIDKDKYKKNNDNPSCFLPPDFNLSIPKIGHDWLSQYKITPKDTITNRIGWSDKGVLARHGNKDERLFAPMMIFPVYDPHGNLLMWQGRYFGDDKKVPKYYTRGSRDCLHLLGDRGIIVLVEDLLSAIKVAKVARAIPLFGSSVNLDLLSRINRITDSFLIWLDKDKYKDAQRFVKRASQYFTFVKAVYTELDPKCYQPAEIERILLGSSPALPKGSYRP